MLPDNLVPYLVGLYYDWDLNHAHEWLLDIKAHYEEGRGDIQNGLTARNHVNKMHIVGSCWIYYAMASDEERRSPSPASLIKLAPYPHFRNIIHHPIHETFGYNPRTGKTRFQMAEPTHVGTETSRQTCLYFVNFRLPEEPLWIYRIGRQVMTLIDDIIHARLRRTLACFTRQSSARWVHPVMPSVYTLPWNPP
ncbi:hypothetical protein PoHVEF18_005155 [Penicillium ochrochloron]